MCNSYFLKKIFFLAFVIIFASCDKEYTSVGDALIGDNNFELVEYSSEVIAYNQEVPPLQSNSLPVNSIGIYDNPAFGTTTANYATQLSLVNLNPVFGNNIEIESVYLDVPYFVDASQTKSIVNNGVAAGNTYVLDSIYGENLGKIKLSLYESDRGMGTINAISQQPFYSNQNEEFDKFKKPYGVKGRLNDADDKSQNDEFFFNPAQTVIETGLQDSKVTTYLVPGMRLKLNSAFFMDRIFKAPKISLSSQIEFQEHFKGLYFKVEKAGSSKGSLALINFARGTITIKYKEDANTTPVTRIEKTLTINLTGNSASLLEENDKIEYETAIKNPNKSVGDNKLYLKGGQGSIAVLNLFGADNDSNGLPDELEKIRREKWLINDANLIFNIDTSEEAMGQLDPSTKKPFIPEPDRIYLYDYTNSRTVLDYSTNLFFGGTKNHDATSGRGTFYKIRITDYIRNLVKNTDAKNSQLGISLIQDIRNSNFSKSKPPATFQAPTGSFMHPLGTILHGNKTADENKKLKLEIIYTKPK